ncbi:MAG: protein jag [Spirochaetales bacterium]|nr:protein jag [Candidatus Physcosoma equi]
MFKDFEGRTEEEARNKAIEELGLEGGDFDVEVLENVKKSLFKKASCKIRVYYGEEEQPEEEDEDEDEEAIERAEEGSCLEPENDTERKVLEFIDTLIQKMGYEGEASINFRRESKVGINIDSPDSSYIIGRKGRNLDAIQLIVNVFAGNIDPDIKIVVDSENYRMRHEEQIIRNAYKTAEQVRKSGRSRLLDPMNPFERRLVHTALNEFEGVETKSEGEGLYKQVRIIPVK